MAEGRSGPNKELHHTGNMLLRQTQQYRAQDMYILYDSREIEKTSSTAEFHGWVRARAEGDKKATATATAREGERDKERERETKRSCRHTRCYVRGKHPGRGQQHSRVEAWDDKRAPCKIPPSLNCGIYMARPILFMVKYRVWFSTDKIWHVAL